jgi:Malectin domain
MGTFWLLLMVSLSTAAQSQQPVRVKCGGPAYKDSKGQTWAADYGFNAGTVSFTSGSVSGTSDPGLFQDGRWGASTPPLIYTFPVANGSYHVNLYFAELYPGDQHIGARVFNVKMQGNVVFQNLDVFAAVGANAALIKGADITVANGTAQIEFDSIADHAKIEAIEILPGTSSTSAANGPQLTLNFVYPDNTPVAGTLNYTLSNSLLNVGGNVPLINGQATCTLISAPNALGLVGTFQVNLSLTDSSGHTLWQLSLGMNPSKINFGAVQSSTMNVVIQKL